MTTGARYMLFAKLIRSESEKWAPVIRKTGVRID